MSTGPARKIAQRLDGKAMAEKILADLKRKVAALPGPPGLAAVLIGNDPASTLYVRNKEKACLRVGITFHKYLCNKQCLPDAKQNDVLEVIAFLNRDPTVHGIIVQLPVPRGFDADTLVSAVDSAKDVDGFHPENIERFLADQPVLAPPVVRAVQQLLREAKVNLDDAHITIVAKDSVLRKTLRKVLVDAGARITAATPNDADLAVKTKTADLVISAIGKPGAITGDLLKPEAVVIDIGITRMSDGTYAGDVDAASVEKVASAFTPTPGGVGPLTVAMLLKNVYDLAAKKMARAPYPSPERL